MLLALIAPRPLHITSAEEHLHLDPRGGNLEVEVPKLGLHEVIAIDGTWRS